MPGSLRAAVLAVVSILLCGCSATPAAAPPSPTVPAKPTSTPICDGRLPPTGPEKTAYTDHIDDWQLAKAVKDGFPNDLAVKRDGTVWVVGTAEVPVKPYLDKEQGCLVTTDTERRGKVWRYDAGTWHVVAPPQRCSDHLSKVDVTEDGSLWVYGTRLEKDDHVSCVARWNGSGWEARTVRTEDPAEEAEALTVSGTDPWFIDSRGRTVRLTKGKLSAHTPVAEADVLARGQGGALWAAGVQGAHRIQLARWDRGRWQRVPDLALPHAKGEPRAWLACDGMVATGPDDVWVAAYWTWNASDESEPGRQVLAHWNGSAWSWHTGKVALPDREADLAPDGQGGVWLTSLDDTTLEHVTGRRHEPIKLPDTEEDVGLGMRLSQRPGTHEVWVLSQGNLWVTRRDAG
ncbi:hypothetical protein ACWEJ6_26235 [Nonomuraea sp. NPDC004702]